MVSAPCVETGFLPLRFAGVNELPDKIRAFVALRMSAEVEDAITRLIDSLRHPESGIRWVARANLHLTLRFLGSAVSRSVVVALDPILRKIASCTAPFALAARGTGVFPNVERPRVVWVGLPSEELVQLALQIEAAAVASGLPSEGRPYSPHLTIGRVRDLRGWHRIRQSLRQASDQDFGSTQITEMVLYRSILGREASQYQELARYPLIEVRER